ncbi:MAG: CotH kinase family protein [Planctomycetota bacterium]
MTFLIEKARRAALLVWVLAIPVLGFSQGLYITEFMAVNESTLRDDDGEFSDWLEVYNDTDDPVNLDGYFLTDDKLELTKWEFPNVTVPARGFVLVIASDKDRRDPAAQLHTNFKLTSLGEYLGLVEPDGSTIVWEYDIFPPQVADFSYGLSQNGQSFNFVSENSEALVEVPTNGNDGLDWTEHDFNDAGWDSGDFGVGYDSAATYRPFIDIDVEDSMEGENTSCYVRVPFEVEDPAGVTGFQLGVRYDDGFIAYLNGVRVAESNAPANASWDSASTDQHDDGAAVAFEDYSFSGALRAGTNVLAFHGLNRNLGSSDFLVSARMSATTSGELDAEQVLYFPTATPASGNVQGFDGVSETPVISTPGTAFQGSIQVMITAASQDVTVRYTTDGSDPNEGSTIADGAINLSTSGLLRARGFEDGKSPSPIVSEGFLRVDASVANASSNIPIFVIENFGGGGPPSNSFQEAFGVMYEPVGGRTRLSNPPTLQVSMGIKIRGSSSAGQAKKQYAIEVWDSKQEDLAVSMLGMPEEADWILYGGNGFDHAMCRNAFIFQLSRDVGAYATRTQWCEVYFNQGGGSVSSNDYIGVYAITEKIDRDGDRVDVNRMTASIDSEPEISGGYMFKIDRLDPGDSGFRGGGRTLGWVYPKEDFVTSTQESWLSDYVDEFNSRLNSGNFTHPTLGYRPYIDTEQWIAHSILNVLSMNADALRLSTFFHKDRNGPIIAGPIWDFDRSMGSSDGRDDNVAQWNGGTNYFAYPWWDRLFDDPDFDQLWIDRWQEWRRAQISTSSQNAILDFYQQVLTESATRNHSRWNWGSYADDMNTMRNWLRSRSTWIDGQLISEPNIQSTSRQIEPGFELEITGGTTIYYTLDGTDPRSPGGAVSPDAIRYTGEIEIDQNAKVVARRQSGSRRNGDRPRSNWSSPVEASFWIREPRLVISEMMFHPPDPFGDSEFDADDFEFVELFNAEDVPLDLEGFSLSGGIEFTFPAGSLLAPGDYVVIVSDQEAFEARYPDPIRVAGEYRGNLGNSGDQVVLHGPLGEPIHNFSYSDQWEPLTDGNGLSLNVVDPFEDLSMWRQEEHWVGSSEVLGSPGDDDPGLSDLGGRQRPGDSNQDGVLDLSDPLHLLIRLFVGGTELPCEGAEGSDGNLFVLDPSGDDNVDLTDAIFLVNYLFQNGPAPAGGTVCVRVPGCPSISCGI